MVVFAYVCAVVIACAVIYGTTTFTRKTGTHLGLSLSSRSAIVIDLVSIIPFVIFVLVAQITPTVESDIDRANTWIALVFTSLVTGVIAGIARLPVRKS